MKKRNLIVISLVILAIVAIAGGTMAWFTSRATPITNTFRAGTVNIDLIEEFDEASATNVNPGDYYKKEVSVKSNGSKQTYVRVHLAPQWIAADKETVLPIDNVVMDLDLTNWVLGEDGWYYYKKIVNENESTTLLLTGVTFKGAETDNRYQGATFTIDVQAEAVQASHYAFRDEWGLDGDVPAPGVEKWVEKHVK